MTRINVYGLSVIAWTLVLLEQYFDEGSTSLSDTSY